MPSATKWSASSGSRAHILNAVMTEENAAPTVISFNLLEGRLLVNGYPLARLPREYESHPTYGELFGPQTLEVMPSTRQGMQFSACREQHGWVVHFALVHGKLVIQAVRRGDGASADEVCELIPSLELKGDVPSSFVRNHSHWLNLSTGAVEFRPVDKP